MRRLVCLCAAWTLLLAPPTAHADEPRPLDNSRRAAVMNAFYETWLANELTDVPFYSEETCEPEPPNRTVIASVRGQLNYFRQLAGLQPIGLDPGMAARARRVAQMMNANNAPEVDADPAPDDDCWTPGIFKTAQQSLLSFYERGAPAISRLMSQPADRERLLDPRLRQVGLGVTYDTTVVTFGGGPTGSVARRPGDPAWVAWPSPGFFPAPLIESDSAWSWFPHSVRTDTQVRSIDASQAHVSMSGPRGPIALTLSHDPTLSWQVEGHLPTPRVGHDVTVTVKIRGLTRVIRKHGTTVTSTRAMKPVTYAVTLVKPERALTALEPPILSDIPVAGSEIEFPYGTEGHYVQTQSSAIRFRAMSVVKDGVLQPRRSLTFMPQDVGHLISLRLIASDHRGYFTPIQLETAPVRVFSRPTIVGRARVGALLRVTQRWPEHVEASARWTANGWYRGESDALSYRIQPRDRGKHIEARVFLDGEADAMTIELRSRVVR